MKPEFYTNKKEWVMDVRIFKMMRPGQVEKIIGPLAKDKK